MTTEVAAVAAASPAQRALARVHGAVAAAVAPRAVAGPAAAIRIERASTAGAAVVGPLLVLQAVPSFLADRDVRSPLAVVSLLLVVGACLLLPVALRRSAGAPHRRWPLAVVGVFAVLALLDAAQLPARTTGASLPWLVAVAPLALGCAAIALPRLAAVLALDAALAALLVAVLAPRVAPADLAADLAVLAGVAAAAVVVLRVLRDRAAAADAVERAALARADAARALVAAEADRTRADALLIDSVLTTLLSAAAAADPDTHLRAAQMAERALAVVADAGSTGRVGRQRFDRAVAGLERELTLMPRLVQQDLAGAYDVVLPAAVAETIVAATLQAVGNSIEHAGPMAARVVRAVPHGDRGIRVTIRDDGRGFDVDAVDADKLGIRVSIVGRMQAVGGTAVVHSTPGAGTAVLLEWHAPEVAS